MGWRIEARRPVGGMQMAYLVCSFDELGPTHRRLIADDPIWAKAHIRMDYYVDPAKAFWDNLKIESVRVRPD